MCENQIIRYSSGTIEPLTKENLSRIINEPKIRNFYIKKLINKDIIFIKCGKCSYCKKSKTSKLTKLLNRQYTKTKYNYFLTLTFNNEHINALVKEQDRYYYNESGNNRISYVSNLSKTKIANIIRNLKKKLNNFYKEPVTFHYSLCGEYGANTYRAHYHIILFLSHPLPNLKRLSCSGVRYETPILKSKQYDMYDLQAITTENANQMSAYISKYITKQESIKAGTKLNLYQEKQLEQALKENADIDNLYLFMSKTDELLYKLYKATGQEHKAEQLKNKRAKKANYQAEFMKKSRNLGKEIDVIENIKNGTASYYDKQKMLKYIDNLENKLFNKQILPSNLELEIAKYYYQALELMRTYSIENIKKYFMKPARRAIINNIENNKFHKWKGGDIY